MTKRLLSAILIIVLTISLAVFCLPANAATIGFTVSPVVLIGGGDEYNIVWENDTKGIGYVTYECDGKKYTVYDEECGVVRSDDKMHTVRVPKEHLDKAGSYTVHAAGVVSRDGYSITRVNTASKTNEFHGYTAQSKISMGFISDSHLISPSKDKKKYEAMLESYTKVVNDYMKRPDIIVLNGDVVNELISEEDFYALFKVFSIAGSGGTYPVLFVVGEREKRGFYSKEIEKYLCYDTGEFYTYFEYGPIASYVTDIGEDKKDEHEEYGGLVDMERYLNEQLNFIDSHAGYSEESVYKLTIGHGTNYVGHNSYDADHDAYRSLFFNYGTDVHISGHDHQLKFRQGNSSVLFHVVSDGGHNKNQTLRSTLVTFENDVMTFKGINDDGSQAYAKTVKASDNGSSAPKPKAEEKEDVTEQTVEAPAKTPAFVPTMAGMSTSTIKGAADTTANITKPVVFDAGQYYSVVWQTTSGVKSAGYVDVQGISKSFMDQHGGKLRTETTHSVRIPKEVFASSKTYTIKSRVVINYNGYGMVENGGNNPTQYGPYATGKTVQFNGNPDNKSMEYTILAVANKTGGSGDAQKLLAKYKEQPDLVVMTGNMTKSLNTEKDFTKVLEYANTLTGGSVPVMLLRGENETKGAFAAYLPRIIHNFLSAHNANKLYTTYSTSNLSIIGLDTATTKKDNHASYYGYAGFDKIRKEQKDWLENDLGRSFSGVYNIVFANASDLTNCAGVDFSAALEKHKIQLVVSAGNSTQFADGGKYYSQATVGDASALLITCKDKEIAVQSIDDDITDLGTVKTADVTYKGNQTTPPIKDEPETPGNNNSSTKDDPDDEKEDTNDQQDVNTDNKTEDEKDDGKKENGTNAPGASDDTADSPSADGVEDDWYNDYLKFNVTISDSDITLSTDVTAGKFLYAVARFAGVSAASESEAVKWAGELGFYDGTSVDDKVSQDTANSIVKSIFTA